jgi:hypothetical protein
MIIDPTSLAYIQTVIKTANLVKIDNIIIEPGKVRAIDSDKTVVLFHDQNVPTMPFGSIGINRIDVFSSRVEMAKSVENFSVEAVVDSSGKEPFVRALLMKGKGIKIDYRCANPQTIQAPKAVHDPAIYRIKMTPEAILLMQKGQSAMSTDEVSFVGNQEGVSFVMSDINSDALTYHFADCFDSIGVPVGTSKTLPTFTHKYPIKTLHSLFKANSDGHFEMTAKGMLKIVVNNLDIYVLARE